MLANLAEFPSSVADQWNELRPALFILDDVLTVDRLAVFPASKDRPILFSALAWADVLITRYTRDFGAVFGRSFYGLEVLTPGNFFQRERRAGRL